MSKVKLLSEALANKIAAGEVVERPASVVKELVENAIDANSHRIFVSTLEGGVGLIEVQDDGEGMTREDAILALQCHATSKLTREEDLFCITTLGFRGEALSSIASIAKIRLVTQTKSGEEGTEIDVVDGRIQSVTGVGAPKGTLFRVRDLFCNTPARKKFLKSTQTELGHISEVVFRMALSFPRIHFRLKHGEKTLLEAPVVSNLQDRFVALFGEDLMKRCVEVHQDAPISLSAPDVSLSIDAFCSRPPFSGNHQRGQYLFVNQRCVKSPLLSRAIYDAYGGFMMKGAHPFFVVFITVDPSWVDVNVHPTKREVRFTNNDEIYRAVKRAIREALAPHEGLRVMNPDLPPEGTSGRGMPAVPARHQTERGQSWTGWPERPLSSLFPLSPFPEGAKAGHPTPTRSDEGADAVFQEEVPLPQLPRAMTSSVTDPMVRPLGQMYGTYLIAEVDGDLVIVDQHTVHERVLFERFQKSRLTGALSVQPLLIPQSVRLPLSRAGLLKEHLKMLEEIGLGVEHFGEADFLIREVPSFIAHTDLAALLVGLAEELSSEGVATLTDQARFNAIALMACHGATRAHQSVSLPEIESLLIQYYQAGCPPTCPHGRPILLKFPLPELERLFKRK